MKNELIRLTCLLTALFALAATARAQGTAFTYQGRLTENGAVAGGIYDLRFTIYDALSAGSAVSSVVTNAATSVSNGVFTVALDFGAGVFDGNARWLEIGVRTNGGGFVTLNPRQPITATPYAMRANSAGSATTVAGLQVNTNLSSTALGFNTQADGSASTAMGNSTVAAGGAATALGQSTLASGAASLASGQESVASGDNSTALGFQTTASGAQATSLGQSTTAGGFNSLAAGTQARANHDGTFVWADYNYVDFASTATNQFLVRAAGGVGINTNNPNGAALAVNGNVSAASVMTPEVRSAGNGPLELYVNNQRGLRLEPTSDEDTVNVIGGSSLNLVGAGVVGATIAGGGKGRTGPFGGFARPNQVEGDYSTVSGGIGHTILANSATIGGGSGNLIETSASVATISGGSGNGIQTNNFSATIGGGAGNTIQPNALSATIGGGSQNTIQPNGQYATIPGGRFNSAANYAFAAGYRAKANHTGAFVWGDSTDADFASTATNQFAIRATGGVLLSDSTPHLSFGSITRQMINLWGTAYGIGVQSGTHYSRTGSGGSDKFAWYQGGTHSDSSLDPGAGGTLVMSLDRSFLTLRGFGNEQPYIGGDGGGGDVEIGSRNPAIMNVGFWNSAAFSHMNVFALSFVPTSDRNLKENFKAVNAREILDKVAALPLSEWNYKADTATRHVGPMAQDFHAAFAVGPDDKHIATVDADGVALAAIQGLNQKLEEQKTENAELRRRMAQLEDLVSKLAAGKE